MKKSFKQLIILLASLVMALAGWPLLAQAQEVAAPSVFAPVETPAPAPALVNEPAAVTVPSAQPDNNLLAPMPEVRQPSNELPNGQMIRPEGQMPEGSRMMEPGRPAGSGGEGQPGPQYMGPSDEDFAKMEQQREEKEQKMRLRGLEQMKKGVKQFGKSLDRLKAKLDKLEQQNLPVPLECKQQIEDAVALVQQVLRMEDPDEIESFDPSALQGAGELMQECGPKIEQAGQLPKIIKKVNSEISRLEKRYQSAAKRAAKANLDLSEVLAATKEKIDQIKAVVGQLLTAEDPFMLLDEELPDKFPEAYQAVESIEGLFQLAKSVKIFNAQLSRYETKVKKLEKAGEDSEARVLLDKFKDLLTELRGVKVTVDNAEELSGKLQELFDLRENLEETLETGQEQSAQFEDYGVDKKAIPQLNLPKLEKLSLELKSLQNYLAKSKELAQVRYNRAKELGTLQSAVAGVKITAPSQSWWSAP